MVACLLLSSQVGGDLARAPFTSAFAQGGGGGGRAVPEIVSIDYAQLRQTLRRMSLREARQWAFELLSQLENHDAHIILVGFSDWMVPRILDIMGTVPDLLELCLRRLDGVADHGERAAILRDLLDQIQQQHERLRESFDQDSDRGFLPEGSMEKAEAQGKVDRFDRARRYVEEWRDNPDQGLVPEWAELAPGRREVPAHSRRYNWRDR